MKREVFTDELKENEVLSIYIETDMGNAILDILKKLSEKYRNVCPRSKISYID